MILLGSYDSSVTQADRDAYLRQAAAISGGRGDQAADGSDKLSFAPHAQDPQQTMTVAEVQEALKAIGFFPGGKVDGICGYRTRAAMRLFQDACARSRNCRGCRTAALARRRRQHLQRWTTKGLASEWAPTIERWRAGTLGQTEYTDWLSLLGKVKEKYLASPTEMLRLVNAFPRQTDTRKVADWDFEPNAIHLVGIRRSEKTNKFDDLFVAADQGTRLQVPGIDRSRCHQQSAWRSFPRPGTARLPLRLAQESAPRGSAFRQRCAGRAVQGRFPARRCRCEQGAGGQFDDPHSLGRQGTDVST